MTAQKHRFIPGIYNYCDYWCERCAFARRCRNFTMGREMKRETRGDQPVEDATNAAFWNGLAERLRETTVFGPRDQWAAGDDDFDEDRTLSGKHARPLTARQSGNTPSAASRWNTCSRSMPGSRLRTRT